MAKIVYLMSMSLDGYVTAAGRTFDEPMGIGGLRLHDWLESPVDPRSEEFLRASVENAGAMVTGRRTYDESVRWWGPDGPAGERRVPMFVLTHRDDPPAPAGSVYTFVTDGLESALAKARAAAGDRDVEVSGVEIARQLFAGGHIDEMWINVVPVLFGDGTHLYEQVGADHIDLELVEAIATPKVTHLHYRVRR